MDLITRVWRGLMASAAFVRGNADRIERMHDALDAVDETFQRMNELEDALRKLTFMACTTGGWKPDLELMAACDRVEHLMVASPKGETRE
jgi:hypothetical protein